MIEYGGIMKICKKCGAEASGNASGDPDGKILLTVFNFITSVVALIATFLLGLSVFDFYYNISFSGSNYKYSSVDVESKFGNIIIGAAVASGVAFALSVASMLISIVKCKDIDEILSCVLKMLWSITVFTLAMVAYF